MFTNAKKILITTESREVIIVRHGGEHAVQGFCPRCGTEVEMLNLDMAVSQTGIGGRDLVHRSEGGDVHSIETDAGQLLFCKSSLTNVFGGGGILTCPLVNESGNMH